MSPLLNNAGPVERVPTPIGEAWVEAGVLWHRIRPGTTIDDERARETVAALTEMVGDQRFPAVVDMRGVETATKGARDIFAADIHFERATALIVDSKLTRALGNVYRIVSRPSRPTRLFTSEEQARQWAHSYVPD